MQQLKEETWSHLYNFLFTQPEQLSTISKLCRRLFLNISLQFHQLFLFSNSLLPMTCSGYHSVYFQAIAITSQQLFLPRHFSSFLMYFFFSHSSQLAFKSAYLTLGLPCLKSFNGVPLLLELKAKFLIWPRIIQPCHLPPWTWCSNKINIISVSHILSRPPCPMVLAQLRSDHPFAFYHTMHHNCNSCNFVSNVNVTYWLDIDLSSYLSTQHKILHRIKLHGPLPVE